ncbi:hypothetical protein NAT51_10025 [Flavobacterium amniphilum]|uniref:hypothetical protein n=1 Tax=Flavobacterium amniphilum TaxID=1834035 RepID=UPI00202A3E54|nr:hypothetical protein [Flavobacterium amniphilum]MCL9805860.1 hypothetical protein [Flavobacterium amniphilum]
MNYQQEYDSIYNSYYLKIEKLIKHHLIAEKAKKRNVNLVHNELNQFLYNNTPSKFEVNNNPALKNLLQLFEARFKLYGEDYINLIFSNEIKTGFNAIQPVELPSGYTIKKLLMEIAIISAIEEVCRLLSINNSLFYLFYNSNDFSRFEIKEYKGMEIDETPIYIELNRRLNPNHYTVETGLDGYFEEIEETTNKTYSLPIAIALLNEVGFFELEKIKNLSPTSLAKIIAIIQLKDPSDKNTNRAISGNVRVLNPDNKENNFKYTSHKHAEKVKSILNEIKQGNS